MHSPASPVRHPLRRSWWSAALLVVATSIATPVAAQQIEYRIEVVLFEHLRASTPSNGSYWLPSPRRAVTLDSSRATEAGFVSYTGERDLADDAERLASSGRYRVLRHLAWQQPGLDDDNAIRVRVTIGSQVPMWVSSEANNKEQFIPASAAPRPNRDDEITSFTVNGTLRVRLGRFLHVESRLVFTDVEEQRSYRLYESRKMRSRELHYVDNPRFGFLVRIVPVEAVEDPTVDAVDTEEGEELVEGAAPGTEEAAPSQN